MSKLSEWIKSVSWDDPNQVDDYLSSCSIEEFLNLIEYLRNIIDEDYHHYEYNPYTFLPNNELSGFGGCSEISCKLRRARQFATFSAIYADDVFLQLNYITSEHFSPDSFSDDDTSYFEGLKYLFYCDISVILEYLPLIEADIAHIEPVRKTYCPDCFQRALLNQNKSIDISSVKKLVEDKVIIEVIHLDESSNTVVVEIKNIDDFFQGENLIIELNPMIAKHMAKEDKKLGVKNKKRPFWIGLINDFVDDEFASSCYYASYCRNDNAKLITSKPSDCMFSSIIQGEDVNTVLATFNNLPQYDMPFITNISILDALRLRNIEHESFNRYRSALDKAVKEQCKTNSKVEWKDIYNDILYPEYNKLDLQLKNIKSGAYSKTFGDILLLSGAITGGKLVGFQTFAPLLVTAGIGLGANLIKNVAENTAKMKENDYYYLWRLKNVK